MEENIKVRWLTDHEQNKIAPKTLASQVLNEDGTLFKDTIATKEDVKSLYEKLESNTLLGFYCVEDVTVIVNGASKTYPANSNVEISLTKDDVFEIIPTSDNSILTLTAFPGALGTYYSWLEGVKQFSNILFDMNSEDMYIKWSQGSQGVYQVQCAQYTNCIFWSDNAYINDVAKRTNYTLYSSSQLPLCYSNIPDNTFKSFYLAFGVNSDPNWSNPAYKESFAKATWATQVFSYYGARVVGLPGLDSSEFNIVLPKDCRGLMFDARNIECAGTFDAANVTNFGAKSGSWREAFGDCPSLRRLYIKNLKVNLNISWSPVDYASISYIISEAANTNKITISVSPYTYYLLNQADFELAAEKNITIELLSTHYSEDKRLNDIANKADKEYVDEAISSAKNDLLNGAGEAYDTLKELGELIDENTDAIEALELIATNKFEQLSQEIVNHKGDTDIHVTATEKETWNAKATTEYVDNKITDLKAQKSQLRVQIPEVNDTMENALAWLIENGDTSKMYVLPDGYIYAYTIGKEEVYTDVLRDIGYQENMRINSSGVIVEWTTSDADVTGYIPCKTGDIIGVKEMPIPSAYTSGAYWNQVAAYDSNKAYIAKSSLCLDDDYPDSYGHALDAVSEDGNIVQFTVKKSIFGENVAYIVINAKDITDESEVYVNSTIVSGYGWRNTGHAFVPADYEDRIIELEETTADHEERLKTLEQYETETIDVPTYWLEELETKADVIQVAMESAGWNKSSFLYYTDAHWTAGNSKKSPLLLKYLFVNTSMNKTKFGGDIIGDPPTLTHDNIKHVYDEWRALIKDLNQDSVLGNHDNFHKGRNDADVAKIVYSFLLAPEEKPNRVMGGDFYYYVDEPCEKTRYLHLDSGRYSLSDEETEFIIETLKSTPDGWHIVVISHIWFQYTAVSEPSVGSITTYMQRALDLFDAYNARQSGSITMVSTSKSYDFTSCGGKVEFCMGGHIHIDLDLYSNGGIPVILTASDVNQERSGNETEDSGTLGTITESAVYGIVADYDNNKISVIGVGRGTSRVVRAKTVTLQSISDISYSGSTNVGEIIDKSKFSFTANYSDGTSDTITGATTVSADTIGIVGNNTVTITYTEGGKTVSGTITIIGTSTQAVNLLNLNRNYVNGTAGEIIDGGDFDDTKAYLNLAYTDCSFIADKTCTVKDVTENSVTITEGGLGGLVVGYPIHLPDLSNGQKYRIKFDYSGSGKCRSYSRYAKSDGTLSPISDIHLNDTAGASGSADKVIDITKYNIDPEYEWLIVQLGSNTSGTKTFTNVSLTKE